MKGKITVIQALLAYLFNITFVVLAIVAYNKDKLNLGFITTSFAILFLILGNQFTLEYKVDQIKTKLEESK